MNPIDTALINGGIAVIAVFLAASILLVFRWVQEKRAAKPKIVRVDSYFARFGGDSDGILDASLAIQAAIWDIALKGGGTLRFPSGRFRVDSTIDIPGGITLEGGVLEGRALPVLRGRGENVRIQNMRITALADPSPVTDPLSAPFAPVLPTPFTSIPITGFKVPTPHVVKQSSPPEQTPPEPKTLAELLSDEDLL